MKLRIVLPIVASTIFLFVSCAEKVTNPTPEEKITYAIADYFPLEPGYKWTWQVHSRDSIPEPYRDGDICLGEPYIEMGGNPTVFEPGIDSFISDCGSPLNQDLNCNGVYDGPYSCSSILNAPFMDFDGDSVYDSPDGQYDPGEPYLDLNNTGERDYSKDYDLKMMIWNSYSYSYYDGTRYRVLREMGIPVTQWYIDYQIEYRNGFSLDSLGLRWHSHFNFANDFDQLRLLKPITIAAESLKVGDSYMYADTFLTDTLVWTSTLVGVENVTVPAGTFPNCLKFEFVASGWIESMAKFNGTSYWWLAKGVGLVKVEGPEGDSWALKQYEVY